MVRGKDDRPVNPNRVQKSIGAERTFNEDITSVDTMFERLEVIAENLFRDIQKSQNYGKTLTLKVKFSDFQTITRSKTMRSEIKTIEGIIAITNDLLYKNLDGTIPVRLLGLSVSNLRFEHGHLPRQLEFEFWA